MAKITLGDLANLSNENTAVSTINSNNALIETAIENTLSRDGTTPNSMNSNLDMNSNRITNLPAPTLSTDVVRKIDLDNAVDILEAEIGSGVPDGDKGDITVDEEGTEWTINADSVSNSKLADVATSTIKGRISSGTGNPEDLTAAQVRTIINVEDGATADQTAAEILALLVTVDGSGSNVDADTLDGQQGTFYATATSLTDHLNDTTAAHAATAISVSPAGSIAAVTVQAALEELDSEKQPLDATLTSLAAYNTNGLLTQTASDIFAGRTLTGTANEVDVTNGNGVSGNPTVSLPSAIDLGGKTSFEIPNSASPTVDADGEIAVDTSVTNFSHGVLKYFGGEEMAVVALPIADLSSPTDGYVVAYNATDDEFELVQQTGGGGGISDGDKGDITVSGSGATWTIDNDVVTDAKLRNSVALSVIGRSANSTGDPADIAAANDGEVLRRSGTTLGFGTVATAGIANDAVTFAKLVGASAQNRFVARISSGAGDYEEATIAQMLSALGLWTPVFKTTTETITADSTLSNDAVLLFAMLANTTYAFRGRVFFDTTNAADFKWRHSGPAAPTLVRIKRSNVIPGGTSYTLIAVDTAYSAADIALTGAGTTGGWVEFEGIIANGANAGDFNFQWAQNASDAGNTSVLAGSYLEYKQV